MSENSGGRGIRRSEADWQALFEAQQQSGLSQSAFCEQHAVSYSAFTNARSRFRTRSTSGDVESDFVPVVLSPAKAVSSEAVEVELSLGGDVVLRVIRR